MSTAESQCCASTSSGSHAFPSKEQLEGISFEHNLIDFHLDTFDEERRKNPEKERNFRLTIRSKQCDEAMDEDAVSAFVKAYSRVLNLDRSYIAVYDFRNYNIPPLTLAYSLGTQMKPLEEKLAKYLRASVIILDNGMMSYVIAKCVDAFNAVMPPPCPSKIVYSEEEAEEFLQPFTYCTGLDEQSTQSTATSELRKEEGEGVVA